MEGRLTLHAPLCISSTFSFPAVTFSWHGFHFTDKHLEGKKEERGVSFYRMTDGCVGGFETLAETFIYTHLTTSLLHILLQEKVALDDDIAAAGGSFCISYLYRFVVLFPL